MALFIGVVYAVVVIATACLFLTLNSHDGKAAACTRSALAVASVG
jgi:hypothetical protein